MRWLVRLVCPPGGVVLDPFAGSASTGVGVLAEGCRFVGIEKKPEYATIARARLHHAHPQRATPAQPPALPALTEVSVLVPLGDAVRGYDVVGTPDGPALLFGELDPALEGFV